MKKAVLLAAAAIAASGSVIAADGAKLYAEKTCNACHGPQGNKPLMPDYSKKAESRRVAGRLCGLLRRDETGGTRSARKGEIVVGKRERALEQHVE